MIGREVILFLGFLSRGSMRDIPSVTFTNDENNVRFYFQVHEPFGALLNAQIDGTFYRIYDN